MTHRHDYRFEPLFDVNELFAVFECSARDCQALLTMNRDKRVTFSPHAAPGEWRENASTTQELREELDRRWREAGRAT